MFPIGDDNRDRLHRPVVTYLLIAANVAVFLYMLTLRGAASQNLFIDNWSVIPARFVHYAAFQQANPQITSPLYLTLITAMFLHGGWLHILGNMLFLYVFGNNVEDRMGRLKFLFFYVFCGYVAAYGFAAGNTGSTTTLVGASGAIAGVLGAYLVVFPRARVTSLIPLGIIFLPLKLPAWGVLGGWFLLQWLYSSGTAVASGAGVAYLAHVFGFVAGAAIALLARPYLAGTRVTSVR
jgi:membrane associated rhomboid family serine protease